MLKDFRKKMFSAVCKNMVKGALTVGILGASITPGFAMNNMPNSTNGLNYYQPISSVRNNSATITPQQMSFDYNSIRERANVRTQQFNASINNPFQMSKWKLDNPSELLHYDLNFLINLYDQQSQDLNNAITILNNQVTSITNTANDWVKAYQELQVQHKQLNKKYEESNSELEDKTKEKDNLEEEKNNLQKEKDNLEEEKNYLKQHLEDVRERILKNNDALIRKTEDLDNQTLTLNALIKEKTELIKNQDTEIKELKNLNDNLTQEKTICNNRISELNNSIDDLEKENFDLIDEKNRLMYENTYLTNKLNGIDYSVYKPDLLGEESTLDEEQNDSDNSDSSEDEEVLTLQPNLILHEDNDEPSIQNFDKLNLILNEDNDEPSIQNFDKLDLILNEDNDEIPAPDEYNERERQSEELQETYGKTPK